MMIRSFGKRALRTFLWTAFLHIVFTAADHIKDASRSSVLHRQKRTWLWNVIHVHEEKQPQNPPETIGKLKNTNFNSNSRYEIEGDGVGDTFRVSKEGDIFVLKKLDRENISEYVLKANIRDTITGSITESSNFSIKVQDINDHTPVFSEIGFGAVDERASKGTMVMIVAATDKDDPTTPNGMVTYTLLNGTTLFSINSKTGEISTMVDTLNRETQSEYKLLVQASDMPGVNGGRSASTVVIINIRDINDNEATFTTQRYHFEVKENEPVGFKIGILDIKDLDEKQNKKPIFTVHESYSNIFDVELDNNNDGVLTVKKELDYETTERYTFTVHLKENVVQPPDNSDTLKKVSIDVSVKDVDEPPVFSKAEYNFSVVEGQKNQIVGAVSAKDADKTSHRIRYSIQDPSSPFNINSETGQLTLKYALDRESQSEHIIQVKAEEDSTSKLNSYVNVKIKVLDVNDNDPELVDENNMYICEKDQSGTVLGLISASDVDENPRNFRFVLTGKNSNFSLHDNLNNTASIILTHGGFSTEKSEQNNLEIEITDGGIPPRKSITLLHLPVCVCGSERRQEYCMAYSTSSVSMSTLIIILLCIVTILVIVILFVLRKRYQKEALVGKSSNEIHEQLVAYDEEGGGEMDTNIYDVSILTSARSNPPPPAMYAIVKKPSACKGDMAVMIEVKKDEADHDRDGIPYDTLHIYGYEGSESLAGSLSSLQSSSSSISDLDYDFLNDWGPRFRTLAQIYGSEMNTSY